MILLLMRKRKEIVMRYHLLSTIFNSVTSFHRKRIFERLRHINRFEMDILNSQWAYIHNSLCLMKTTNGISSIFVCRCLFNNNLILIAPYLHSFLNSGKFNAHFSAVVSHSLTLFMFVAQKMLGRLRFSFFIQF